MGIHHLRFGGLRDALIDGVPGSAGSLRCGTRAPAPRIGTFPVISTVQAKHHTTSLERAEGKRGPVLS